MKCCVAFWGAFFSTFSNHINYNCRWFIRPKKYGKSLTFCRETENITSPCKYVAEFILIKYSWMKSSDYRAVNNLSFYMKSISMQEKTIYQEKFAYRLANLRYTTYACQEAINSLLHSFENTFVYCMCAWTEHYLLIFKEKKKFCVSII